MEPELHQPEDDSNDINGDVSLTRPAPTSPPKLPSSPPATEMATPSSAPKPGAGYGAQVGQKPPASSNQPLPATTAIKKTSKVKPGKSIRGSGFGQAEIHHLLGLLDEHLPLCKDEWDYVLREHHKMFPLHQRTVESLRRKFATLHRKKMPTGDPLMPADVRRAKHIRYRITERADMGVMDDKDDEFLPAEDGINGVGVSNDGVESVPCSSGDASDDSPEKIASPSGSVVLSDDTPTPSNSTVTPRPLTSRRPARPKQDDDDIMALLKAQIVQDGVRREEERKQREEERILLRERQEQDAKRHERLMEMMLMVFCRGQGSNSSEGTQNPSV